MPSRATQRGLSLVELMVGMTVGMFVVAGGAMLVGGQLSENRKLLVETQIQQDLRSSADIITRELRRAGYWSTAEEGVWTRTSDASPNPFAAISPSTVTEVGFRYRRGSGQEGPYGFKLESYAIKTQLAASGWQELTDPRTMRITNFSITQVDTPASILPCPKLCTDGTDGCWPRLFVREFQLMITGQSVSDPSVSRSLSTNVRLRNDYVRFNPLTPTEACPP